MAERLYHVRIQCTDLLLKYRDMARTIWNSGFWPNDEMRSGDHFIIGEYAASFNETAARLYEGMVLLPLGHECRVQDVNFPGEATPLMIEVSSPATKCLIDQNFPNNPYHRWEPHDLPLQADTYELEFRNFFDWDQLGHRDFLFFEVLIRRIDARPDAAGHYALVPVAECSVWMLVDQLPAEATGM